MFGVITTEIDRFTHFINAVVNGFACFLVTQGHQLRHMQFKQIRQRIQFTRTHFGIKRIPSCKSLLSRVDRIGNMIKVSVKHLTDLNTTIVRRSDGLCTVIRLDHAFVIRVPANDRYRMPRLI
ncbi:Uncharacterised protein [Vibrio cholerae]|uniref:Uncharacterized protein n=1 Tax=Vibrio cholerae TaxID=666 RepID=A0A656A3K2_VIBCL|nr:Uncharacterised protein [Vibrio cholerae]CSA32448.1 Uncharacterised protein [Vibrio cholerae]CSC91553.1 Uncharacterised protein [Vibrio cholerae]